MRELESVWSMMPGVLVGGRWCRGRGSAPLLKCVHPDCWLMHRYERHKEAQRQQRAADKAAAEERKREEQERKVRCCVVAPPPDTWHADLQPRFHPVLYSP